MYADEAAAERIDVEQPRAFGYVIGDKFERKVRLQLRKPYRLVAERLPRSGRLTEWLAIEQPQWDEAQRNTSTRYDIRFVYQLVNINADMDSVAVPDHLLHYSDGKETLKVLIPASRIGVSMLRTTGNAELQANRAPQRVPFVYASVAIVGGLLITALLVLAWLQWGLPSPAHLTPFRNVHRRLRKAAQRDWDDEQYRDALRSIHAAFNDTAGRIVFAETLAEFFAAHERFEPLHEAVTQFFLRSRVCFFEDGASEYAERYRPSELLEFAARCADMERGLG